MKTCEKCSTQFEISPQEKTLLAKLKVGESQNCPSCREQKRLSFRNEKTLYKQPCDLCGKSTVSTYHKDSPFKVYCQECFWGDGWNALSFGREYDPSRPFFEQFGELMKEVPRLALVNKQSENSEYCNYSFANKNCYLTFGNHYEEDCMYGRYSTKNRDCLDYYWLYESELCYECIFSGKCYKCVHLDHCTDCNDCYFSFDLKGCKNCLFSHGLRNKQYFIFNKEHSREEYEKYFESLQMGRVDQWKKLQEGWEKYKREKAVFRDNYQTNCENCDGNNLQNSKDLQNCFSCSGCDECVNGFQMDETVSSADNSHMGYDKCELCYNCIGCSGISNCLSCDSCWHGNDLAYCNLCFSSRDCLGCVAMRNNQYVILNKQYEREEYEKLRAKIVAEMREWGEFFPWELHPFAYNESVAIEYFEMDRDEVEGAGLKWREIEEVSSGEEVEKVLKCEVTGRQFRLTSREMAFYEKMGIPYPRRCPDQRQKDRQALANPWMMWERKCDKCGAMVKSAFEPGRSEKVYCEGCYLGEVW